MNIFNSFTRGPTRIIKPFLGWHCFLIFTFIWLQPIQCASIGRSGPVNSTASIDLTPTKLCSGKIYVVGDSVLPALGTYVIEGALIEQPLSLFRTRVHEESIKFFWTENSNSHYGHQAGLSFGLVAHDLCRVLFGSSLWQPETLACVQDVNQRQACDDLADRLATQVKTVGVDAVTRQWNFAIQLLIGS
ncbi:secreted protein [Melampsora americana]|nr:secreted protein [Melampsora americana]